MRALLRGEHGFDSFTGGLGGVPGGRHHLAAWRDEGIGNLARYDGGWFKAWRKAWESDLGRNLYLWGLWQALLYMATWKETKILWEGRQRVLPPGSVVFGYRELADRFGVSHTTIKRWSEYLHDTGRIVLESAPRGTIATICNWSEYQGQDDEAVPQEFHKSSTGVPQRDPYEESKKEERRKYISPDEFKLLWNENRGSLPEMEKLSSKRIQAIKRLTAEEPRHDYWARLIRWLATQDWATGQTDKPWIATVDYILRPGKHHELAEKAKASRPQLKLQPKDISSL
jgi:hypothetical protein